MTATPSTSLKSFVKLGVVGGLLTALGACSTVDRLASVGKAPEITPIEDVDAPLRQRSISVPMPSRDVDRYEPNSLWRVGARAFFRDQRASRIGDILTVNVAITDSAQIGNNTTRTRQTDEGAGITNFLGLETQIPRLFTGEPGEDGTLGPNDQVVRNAFNPSSLIDGTSTSSYAGNGTVNRSEAINLQIAAIVSDVLPNGNLVIEGRQEVRVNFEKRELLIAGVVRPEDISAQNVIQHSQIAEARIIYGGQGQITDVQQPRVGTQLYDIIFPF